MAESKMRKITDIYKEYNIMPHLAMHMLRVAAVANIICDTILIAVDKESIIKAALIHDMGNAVKFDLDHARTVFGLTGEDLEKAKNARDEFVAKYGESDYEANEKISRELIDSKKIIDMISGNRFSNMCADKDADDFEVKILHYADGRVGPNGILSFNERMDEASVRYKNHKFEKNIFVDDKRLELVQCGRDIEAQIFVHCSIKPQDITNESVEKYIEALKEFEI
jgi:hypothetical protein